LFVESPVSSGALIGITLGAAVGLVVGFVGFVVGDGEQEWGSTFAVGAMWGLGVGLVVGVTARIVPVVRVFVGRLVDERPPNEARGELDLAMEILGEPRVETIVLAAKEEWKSTNGAGGGEGEFFATREALLGAAEQLLAEQESET